MPIRHTWRSCCNVRGILQDTPSTSVFRMLAHAPAVAAPALQLAAAILTETALDAKVRQLVILRVVQRYQARYAWVQHAAIVAAAGVGDEQIAALERGEAPHDLFTYQERLALAFAPMSFNMPGVCWSQTERHIIRFLTRYAICVVARGAFVWCPITISAWVSHE